MNSNTSPDSHTSNTPYTRAVDTIDDPSAKQQQQQQQKQQQQQQVYSPPAGFLYHPKQNNQYAAANANTDDSPSPRQTDGFVKLHRDYLQHLDDDIIQELPWNTIQERQNVDTLLQQRTQLYDIWSKGITIFIYTLLISMVILFVLVPKQWRYYHEQDGKRLNIMTILISCIFVLDVIFIGTLLVVYFYYNKVDQTIQHYVRRLMDEKDLGIQTVEKTRPVLQRNDSSQQGYFELPEFINVVLQRTQCSTSLQQPIMTTTTGHHHNHNNHSQQLSASTITFNDNPEIVRAEI